MDIALEFNELTSMELVTIDGGCKLCTIGSVIGGAGTGADRKSVV